MKIEELKHNHSLTNLLKILLFTILMLAPIAMVGVKCGYVMFNKNAYQSYYGETINEKTYENVETYTLNKEYHFQMDGYTSTFNNSSSIYLTNVKNYAFPTIATSLQTALDNNEVYKLEFTNYNNAPLFKLYSESNQNQSLQNFNGVDPFQFDFTLLSYNTNSTTLDLFVKEIKYNNYSYLDNVFEYSVSQLEESNLFNWTENTAIYSGINAMNVQLGINSPAITITLTYWLILTCIYVIIDIVLKLFTILTHFIGSKTSS